jgi:integral membrane sensor domain MASE1
LSTLREVLLLSLFSLVPGALLGAGIECVVDTLERRPVSWMDFLVDWTGFSLAGLADALVVLSLVMVRGKSNLFAPQRRLEAIALILCITLITHGIWTSPRPLVFLLLPFLDWSATRFDMASMNLELILVALIALHHTGAGNGPYAGPPLTIEMGALMLQSFIGIAAFGGMVLSSILAQRRIAFDSLLRV